MDDRPRARLTKRVDDARRDTFAWTGSPRRDPAGNAARGDILATSMALCLDMAIQRAILAVCLAKSPSPKPATT
jgi:hypothetical protein